MKVPHKLNEIKLRYIRKQPRETVVFRSSQEVFDALITIWDMNTIDLHETLVVLFVNRAMVVLGYRILSIGGYVSAIADSRSIMATALLTAATGFIVAHNHPTGVLTPSNSDIALTSSLARVASHHDIQLLDHLIVTRDSYYSFADEGRL